MIKMLIILLLLPSLCMAGSDNIGAFKDITDMYFEYDTEEQPIKTFSSTGKQLLNDVNNYVNKRIKYVDEMGGRVWQTPAQTEKDWSGDCEDYAIYKWHLLRKKPDQPAGYGIPESDMWFLTGFNLETKQPHTVLMVLLDGKFYYLDNLDNLDYTKNDLETVNLNKNFMWFINRFGWELKRN